MMRTRLCIGFCIGALLASLIGTSCKSTTVVVPAMECPDPCCGGNAQSVDCAINPNIQCVEDADICSARLYGCADGSYFLMDQPVLPTSCAGDADLEASLVFGDASFVPPQDGGDGLEADSPSEEDGGGQTLDGGAD